MPRKATFVTKWSPTKWEIVERLDGPHTPPEARTIRSPPIRDRRAVVLSEGSRCHTPSSVSWIVMTMMMVRVVMRMNHVAVPPRAQ